MHFSSALRNTTILMTTKRFFQFTLLFVAFLSFDTFANISTPGLIPLKSSRPPATDLFYEGQILLTHEANELMNGGVDISRIDPADSDVWKDNGQHQYSTSSDDIIVESGDSVSYLSPVASRTGNFRFSAILTPDLVSMAHTYMLGKKVHNVLLRAKILEKLGYNIPAIKYLPSLKLKFSSKFEKENFIRRMEESTFGDHKRWVVAESDNEKEVELHDLIVMENDNHIYNLALGFIPSSTIQGRRVFNSLLIPYALTDIPESVNLFPWHAGTIVAENVKLPYDEAEEFTTSIEDAKWMLRRLLTLKRSDFAEIAKAGFFPRPVEKLVLEKLISRRNTLNNLFEMGFRKRKFDVNVSSGQYLRGGKLKKELWEGYASRFSFGDPDSPLATSEIKAYFKSKVISQIISNLTSVFNSNLVPHVTNDELTEKIYARQLKTAKENFMHFLKTGENKKTPISVYAIPTYGANLIVSREIVAGSYLGTDNTVQLADTFGISVYAGAYLGFEGIAKHIPESMSINGQTKVVLTRRYSHLTPIKSMEKAIKTPYKNIAIPWIKKKYASALDDLSASNLDAIEESEAREEKIKEILGEFKENLNVGDSLIITDSLGAALNLRAQYNIASNLNAYAGFLGNQLVVSRLHIHRSNKDTIQIYKDFGHLGTLGLNFGLRGLSTPILSIQFNPHIKGGAKTKFYTLNIDDDEDLNPDMVSNVTALRALLENNSMELIESKQDPYLVDHKINAREAKMSFLLWKMDWKDIKDFITVTHPTGAARNYYKKTVKRRKGKNYSALMMDVLNGVISEVGGMDDISFSDNNSGDPGDSYKGNSLTRAVSFEAQVAKLSTDKRKGKIKSPFASVIYKWKGWKLSYRKLKKLVRTLNSRFGFQFYPQTVLHETQSLQLYNIYLKLYFYQKSLQHMSGKSRKEIEKIFKQHFTKAADRRFMPWVGADDNEEELREEMIYNKARFFYIKCRRYLKYWNKGDIVGTTKYAAKMVSFIESTLDLDGILKMVGGKQNVFIHSQIQGFREGDENGDTSLISNTIGEIGDKYYTGPLASIKNKTGMTDAEFFISWLIK